MSKSIIQLDDHRELTEDEYAKRRDAIAEKYKGKVVEAMAARDQAMAQLFCRSGWTQERIAKAEGKSRQWVTCRLRFGRFLRFATTGSNGAKPPANLTERRFRGYWEQSEKNPNENIRMREVARLIEGATYVGDSHKPKPDIARPIIEHFGNGQWVTPQDIANTVEADVPAVTSVLEGMRRFGTYETHCERRRSGKGWAYRVVPGDSRKINVGALLKEIEPFIKALHVEGKKNAATASPAAVAIIARDIEKLLEKLAR